MAFHKHLKIFHRSSVCDSIFIYKSCQPSASSRSLSSCTLCNKRTDKIESNSANVFYSLSLLRSLTRTRTIKFSRSVSTTTYLEKKKDYYKEDKLPIFDYGKANPHKKRFYTFGQASHGGLGLSSLLAPRRATQKQIFFMQRPVRNQLGDKHTVTDIAAGYGFTLVVTKPKEPRGAVVYGTGYNLKSQLGYQPNYEGKPMNCLIAFVPVSLPLDRSSNVLAIAAGRGHSIMSVEGKGLITLGDNSSGQCGRKIIPDEEYMGSKYICRIPPFGSTSDEDVVRIASKFDVNVCVTRIGNVYTFGSNFKGQLGRGKDIDNEWLPKLVKGDLEGEKVVKVTTNGASMMAVTVKGELFGWGANDCGQINPAETSTIHYQPIHVNLPSKMGKIIDVALGDLCTFVLTEFGDVYVWGTGYALGLGPKNLVVKSPTIIPPPLFGRNEFSPDVSVVSIGASCRYSAAVNSANELFTWGKNESGCLGLGRLSSDYQYFPFKVVLGGPVHKFCLGADHSVVMTKGAF